MLLGQAGILNYETRQCFYSRINGYNSYLSDQLILAFTTLNKAGILDPENFHTICSQSIFQPEIAQIWVSFNQAGMLNDKNREIIYSLTGQTSSMVDLENLVLLFHRLSQAGSLNDKTFQLIDSKRNHACSDKIIEATSILSQAGILNERNFSGIFSREYNSAKIARLLVILHRAEILNDEDCETICQTTLYSIFEDDFYQVLCALKEEGCLNQENFQKIYVYVKNSSVFHRYFLNALLDIKKAGILNQENFQILYTWLPQTGASNSFFSVSDMPWRCELFAYALVLLKKTTRPHQTSVPTQSIDQAFKKLDQARLLDKTNLQIICAHPAFIVEIATLLCELNNIVSSNDRTHDLTPENCGSILSHHDFIGSLSIALLALRKAELMTQNIIQTLLDYANSHPKFLQSVCAALEVLGLGKEQKLDEENFKQVLDAGPRALFFAERLTEKATSNNLAAGDFCRIRKVSRTLFLWAEANNGFLPDNTLPDDMFKKIASMSGEGALNAETANVIAEDTFCRP
ncbi:MAG: hypothetical protein HY939_05995 [Gammaproteobacteria bacterium]|nr:hypothetical protein [Gammaproteobacteria bacterium]